MCGICGSVSRQPLTLESVIKQLTRVNHRGHEAVGIAAVNGSGTFVSPSFVASGLVREACNANQQMFREFSQRFSENQPRAFIGHTRYSTVGSSEVRNAQPFKMYHPVFGHFYLAHNGQVPNHEQLRKQLELHGQRFVTESDSETLAAMIAHCSAATLPEAVVEMMRRVEGAYSLLVLGKHHFVAARDRHGVWPLWLSVLPGGDTLFASEEGSLGPVMSAREILPGTIVSVNISTPTEIQSCQISSGDSHRCWLDVVYLARPDEGVGATIAADVRFALGQRLARTCPVTADLVTGVPDSGIDAAQGFAQTSGIPLCLRAMVRNRFAPGRSFILPGETGRQDAVLDKQSVTRRSVDGKRVVIVDDSIVRSTTSRIITQMMREAGASEVHWRIAAAPIRFPCFYGIDMPSTDQLPAHRNSWKQIAASIGADSVCYLSFDAMHDCLSQFHHGWCTACTTGKYPIPIH